MSLKLSSSPQALFWVFVILVVALASTGAFVALQTTDEVKSTSNSASEQAGLAQLAAKASDRLRIMEQITERRVQVVLDSSEIEGLSPNKLEATLSWLDGNGETSPPGSVAELSAPFEFADAVAFQAAVDYLQSRLDLLLASVGSPTTAALSQQIAEAAETTIDDYYQEPTLENLRDLRVAISGLLVFTESEVPRLSAEALSLRDELGSSISLLRWGAIGLGVIGAVSVLAFGFYISRTTQRLLSHALEEQNDLAELTQSLEYRNDQLSALYNVFSEITDTLSLEHVVDATLRESMQIMRADMATLRVLRGNELVPVGAMASSGQEISGLRPVELGVGPTGRTAKRARTMRINEGGERTMQGQPGGTLPGQSPSDQTKASPMESGMIVPLVVGARVVGTLACWSRSKSAFNDEDQRLLEMMASQVATAIAAADATETSERRAHQDPLTSLPNRRQLTEDLGSRLSDLSIQGRNAVVAMLDIDNFKLINDQYGHQTGDVALQRIANVLRKSVREGDFVYRFGGEEFVIVFVDATLNEAKSSAERLRAAVSVTPLSNGNGEPSASATISIGLALLPEHGTDMLDLIDLADKAMYRAKTDGRDRVVVWSEDPAAEDETAAA